MPSSKIVVIYSVDQARVRRYTIPDNDDQISAHSNPGKGEAVLLMDYEGYLPSPALINNRISQVTGKQTKDDRYFIVNDKGDVENTLLMDPLTDDLDNLNIKADKEITHISDLATVIENIKNKVPKP